MGGVHQEDAEVLAGEVGREDSVAAQEGSVVGQEVAVASPVEDVVQQEGDQDDLDFCSRGRV